jgi:hypothetical protein
MDRVRGPSETPQAKLRDSVSLDTSLGGELLRTEIGDPRDPTEKARSVTLPGTLPISW